MIYYEVNCIYCKKPFKLIEGTKKYQLYKQNRNGRYACDDCERCIEADARKYLFDRD